MFLYNKKESFKKLLKGISTLVVLLVVTFVADSVSAIEQRFVGDSLTDSSKFGTSVAIYDNYALVGVPFDDTVATDAGAAILYKKNNNDEWEFLQKITPIGSNLTAGQFGSAVAISDEYVAISAIKGDGNRADTGLVSVYELNKERNSVSFLKNLYDEEISVTSAFGTSVAINSNTVVVGDPKKGSSGSVYIYDIDLDNNIDLNAIILPDTGSVSSMFGYSVDIADGYMIAVGAPKDTNGGSVYVYRVNRDLQWYKTDKFNSSEKQVKQLFGQSVSLFANYSTSPAFVKLAVGSPGLEDKGAVYMYDYIVNPEDENKWEFLEKIVDPELSSGDMFGNSVAIDLDGLVVGSPKNDQINTDAGIVVTYKYDGISWKKDQFVSTNDLNSGANYAYSVDISNDDLIIGAPNFILDENSSLANGAFYFYSKSLQNKQVLDVSGIQTLAELGSSFAVYGKYAVVGSPNRANSSGQRIGMVAVFEKNEDGSWRKTREIMNEDAGANSDFGTSVAMNADYIFIGSPKTTVNNKSAAGAVFVYKKDAEHTLEWLYEQTITDDIQNHNDLFGTNVMLENDNLIISKHQDDVNLIDSGTVYIYRNHDGRWLKSSSLGGNQPVQLGLFGKKMAVSNDWLAVVVDKKCYEDYDRQCVELYNWNGENWLYAQTLISNYGSNKQKIKISNLSISKDNLVIAFDGSEFGYPRSNGYFAVYHLMPLKSGGSYWYERAEMTPNVIFGEYDDKIESFADNLVISDNYILVSGVDKENGNLLEYLDLYYFDEHSRFVDNSFENMKLNLHKLSRFVNVDMQEDSGFAQHMLFNGSTVFVGSPFYTNYYQKSGLAVSFDVKY